MVDKIIGGIIREVSGITKDDIKESIISELLNLTESKGLTENVMPTEGVADKYAEKQFGIQDPSKEQDRTAIQAMGSETKPDDPKGELVGNIVDRFSSPIGGNKKIPGTNIYLNPRSLNEFEEDVKAVSDTKGNLFVEQADADVYHSDIVNAVEESDLYDGYIGNAYDGQDTITWHRIQRSNDFGFSVSYLDFNKFPENHPQRDKLLSAVKQKNPQFNFLSVYWREEYSRRYDDENNINNSDLSNYDKPDYSAQPKSYPVYSNMSESNGSDSKSDDFDIEGSMDEEFLVEYSVAEGIDVWHGSTEKFQVFDMTKVGTGDGKSLGGWGIYFSENPEVSKRYYLPKGQLKQHEIKRGNYFDLDEPLNDGERILQALERQGVSEKDIDEFRETYVENPYDTTGKQAYDWLSFVLGGEMQASKFLESIGYIGNTMLDRWEPDSRNYVVFDSKSIIQ